MAEKLLPIGTMYWRVMQIAGNSGWYDHAMLWEVTGQVLSELSPGVLVRGNEVRAVRSIWLDWWNSEKPVESRVLCWREAGDVRP